MTSFLTEQIGPLPGGAWLGVVGGGLAIGFLGRRKRTASAAAAVPVPATTAQDQSSQGAVTYAGIGTGVTTMGTPKYATNEEWAAAAVAYLIGRGTLANRATNAISHILYPDADNPTSPEDSALYNMAAAGVGLPPSLPGQAYIPDAPSATPPLTLAERLAKLVNPNLIAGQLSGSGYYNPGETTTAAGAFDYIPDQPTAYNVLKGGQTLYYEPSPGVFADANAPGVTLRPGQYGTPLYLKRV